MHTQYQFCHFWCEFHKLRSTAANTSVFICIYAQVTIYVCRFNWYFIGVSNILACSVLHVISGKISTRELHGDGDDGITAVTAVVPR